LRLTIVITTISKYRAIMMDQATIEGAPAAIPSYFDKLSTSTDAATPGASSVDTDGTQTSWLNLSPGGIGSSDYFNKVTDSTATLLNGVADEPGERQLNEARIKPDGYVLQFVSHNGSDLLTLRFREEIEREQNCKIEHEENIEGEAGSGGKENNVEKRYEPEKNTNIEIGASAEATTKEHAETNIRELDKVMGSLKHQLGSILHGSKPKHMQEGHLSLPTEVCERILNVVQTVRALGRTAHIDNAKLEQQATDGGTASQWQGSFDPDPSLELVENSLRMLFEYMVAWQSRVSDYEEGLQSRRAADLSVPTTARTDTETALKRAQEHILQNKYAKLLPEVDALFTKPGSLEEESPRDRPRYRRVRASSSKRIAREQASDKENGESTAVSFIDGNQSVLSSLCMSTPGSQRRKRSESEATNIDTIEDEPTDQIFDEEEAGFWQLPAFGGGSESRSRPSTEQEQSPLFYTGTSTWQPPRDHHVPWYPTELRAEGEPHRFSGHAPLVASTHEDYTPKQRGRKFSEFCEGDDELPEEERRHHNGLIQLKFGLRALFAGMRGYRAEKGDIESRLDSLISDNYHHMRRSVQQREIQDGMIAKHGTEDEIQWGQSTNRCNCLSRLVSPRGSVIYIDVPPWVETTETSQLESREAQNVGDGAG
jgi:hypothetical protein